jgi:hypothetical protein
LSPPTREARPLTPFDGSSLRFPNHQALTDAVHRSQECDHSQCDPTYPERGSAVHGENEWAGGEGNQGGRHDGESNPIPTLSGSPYLRISVTPWPIPHERFLRRINSPPQGMPRSAS